MQVHGATYHMASRLFSDDPGNGLYAQVYLYDHSTALKRRTSTTLRLRDDIVADLQNMMDRESPYVQLYRHMRDIVREHRAPDAYLGFAAARDEDLRRYDHPQQLEQAIVFVGKEGEPPINRDIVLWPHEFAAHRISELSEHLDPLAYPLLFPRGELGWHPALRHDARHRTDKYNRITPIQFFAHRLMVRRDDQGQGPRRSILPHCGGMLFQQFICDAYSRAEAQRLNWYRQNQASLRVEQYQGLYDAVYLGEQTHEKPKIGTQVLLPSSYPGCPRAMQQNYLDALCLVRQYGRIDFS